ncbi:MAG: hypothetical protein NUV80_06600 [Candidatus Berkelbacteria bacterium]|nr:hypothetical protein [Candidatus Berkelbacteria bacterium]
MTLLICVIGVLIVLIYLLTLIPSSMTETILMAMRIKQIKCPRCRRRFEPNAQVIADELSACSTPKCGLELVNLHKLKKRFNVVPFKKPAADIVELNFEEPLEIHVIDADNKYVT